MTIDNKKILLGLASTMLLYNIYYTNDIDQDKDKEEFLNQDQEDEFLNLENDFENSRNRENNHDLETKIILTNAEIKAKKMILDADIEINKMKSELELLRVKIEGEKIISDAKREADKIKYNQMFDTAKEKPEKMKIIADVYQQNKELFDKYGNYIIPLILDL